MSADLKRRPSGVPGVAVQDAVHGCAVRGGKYWLVHEPSGGLLGFYPFRTIKGAKAAAAALAPYADWTTSAPDTNAGALEEIVETLWRADMASVYDKLRAAKEDKHRASMFAVGIVTNEAGYCWCGLAPEDPEHRAWHQVHAWNSDLRARHLEEREQQFAKELAQHERRQRAVS